MEGDGDGLLGSHIPEAEPPGPGAERPLRVQNVAPGLPQPPVLEGPRLPAAGFRAGERAQRAVRGAASAAAAPRRLLGVHEARGPPQLRSCGGASLPSLL